MQLPVVYFGPFAAYKHGGKTQGPRYMNLRLFYALEKLAEIENSTVTVLNWPVDDGYEIIQDPSIRDAHIKEYMSMYFGLYEAGGVKSVHTGMEESDFEVDIETISYKNIVNRLKVIAGLNPYPYKEIVSGKIEMNIRINDKMVDFIWGGTVTPEDQQIKIKKLA